MQHLSVKFCFASFWTALFAHHSSFAQTDIIYQHWQSDADRVELQTLEHGNIRAELSGGPTISTFAKENARHAKIDISVQGILVVRYTSDTRARTPSFKIEFQNIISGNETPELILFEYTGGAHCCTHVMAFSKNDPGRWDQVELGSFDGEIRFEDINDDGISELIVSDDRFLKAYASHACSYRPWKIMSMKTGQSVDITRHKDTIPIHQSYLKKLSESGGEERCSAGYWPAYIAANAYLGQGNEAWSKMVEAYKPDAYPYRNRVICTDVSVSFPKCPEELKQSMTYPELLERDFKEIGLWAAVTERQPKDEK